MMGKASRQAGFLAEIRPADDVFCLLDETAVDKELQQILGVFLVLLHDLLEIFTNSWRHDGDVSLNRFLLVSIVIERKIKRFSVKLEQWLWCPGWCSRAHS